MSVSSRMCEKSGIGRSAKVKVMCKRIDIRSRPREPSGKDGRARDGAGTDRVAYLLLGHLHIGIGPAKLGDDISCTEHVRSPPATSAGETSCRAGGGASARTTTDAFFGRAV